jgi:hypothetical protein
MRKRSYKGKDSRRLEVLKRELDAEPKKHSKNSEQACSSKPVCHQENNKKIKIEGYML